MLVAVMLSAQCTDVTVNKVTEKLFAKYKTLDEYVHADPTEFEKDIKSTGFYHTKAKNVIAAAKLIQTKFNSTVPKTMEEMLTIPGVARKTANVVLGNAYGVVVGIAVDTHVLRLSQRMRLVDLTKIGGKKLMIFERGGRVFIEYTKDADPVKIEKELMAVIPKKDWFTFTYLLIDHGRAVCRAQNPNCAGCVVNRYCPSSRLQV
jgi:endonuclease-3